MQPRGGNEGAAGGKGDASSSGGSPSVRSLMALYTAGCAPLSSATLIEDLQDMETEDFTVATAVEEIGFLRNLSDTSLGAAVDYFSKIPLPISPPPTPAATGTKGGTTADSPLLPPSRGKNHEEDDKGGGGSGVNERISAALLATAAVARRLSSVLANLNQFCMNAADRVMEDPTNVIRELEVAARQGIRATEGPLAERLGEVFDLTPNNKWATIEVPLRNRVGFKETAAVISEGKVEEEALKETQVRRRKQRNPTGFHKFNFKDLGFDESSDYESEGRGGGGRAGASTTDEGSTRGSISTGPIGGLAPPAPGGVGGGAGGGRQTLSSRSVSSNDDETTTSGGGGGRESFQLTERSSSTVVFSGEKERQIIEDPAADPEWEAQQRHQRRFSRIRNRIPTGHPSLMRNSSDELAGILHTYEQSLSGAVLDDMTAENTETNKIIPTVANGVPAHGGGEAEESSSQAGNLDDTSTSRKTVTMASGF